MDRYAFLVTGPNCCGKTTVVEHVLEKLAADDFDRHIFSVRADNDSRFKGKTSDQEKAILEVWESKIPIIIIEGTDRISRVVIPIAKVHKARQLEVLMIVQKPDVMKAHLEARCVKKNKTFRREYWNFRKLEYEGMKRYPNYFRKHYITPRIFTVDLEYQVSGEIETHLEARIREVLHVTG